ncbi:MAG TPA: DUF3109 domain-containing protein [Bacteroides sp.]|nr:DUF3109 domain-containing protein [Bacteroides sp.]
MIQIQDVIVSLDIFREKFLCDLDACKGECCVEGDAGAPVELDEVARLEEVLPVVWDNLSPAAREVIDRQGVVYPDRDGELVTSIVNGKDCVFTCYDERGCCCCAIEKAYREGKTSFYKPISCHLYPIRVGHYGPYKALNYHRWSVCRAAVLLGEKEDVPVYKFLKEPLTRRFGEAWYAELETAADELKKQGYL